MLERGFIMKYTSPLYNMENVEVCDVVTASIVSIAYVNKVMGKDENNNDIVVPTTQVTVDVSNLF